MYYLADPPFPAGATNFMKFQKTHPAKIKNMQKQTQKYSNFRRKSKTFKHKNKKHKKTLKNCKIHRKQNNIGNFKTSPIFLQRK